MTPCHIVGSTQVCSQTLELSDSLSSFDASKARDETEDGRKSNLPDLLIISSEDEVEEEAKEVDVDGDGGRATTAAEVSSAFGPGPCLGLCPGPV